MMNRLGQGELAEGGGARDFTLTSQSENDSSATFIPFLFKPDFYPPVIY